MGYRKTGKKCASDLIRKLWDIQRGTWQYRNSKLRDTPLADIMK